MTDPPAWATDQGEAAYGAEAPGALRLLYQPIIRFADMRPVCMEVLARMMTPAGVLEGPEALLAAMVDQESSLALTGMVLRRGLLEQADTRLDRYGFTIIFNMPLDAMLHPGMVGIINAIRAEGPGKRLVSFELTERHPVRDVVQVGQIIAALNEAGYGVALDDVTPATPNLAALLELPLRTIKLDYSVVTSGTEADAAFIRGIVAATAPRGQKVVAEGIETHETLQRMRALGVTHGQGFLFARPMTAAVLPAFLDGWHFPGNENGGVAQTETP